MGRGASLTGVLGLLSGLVLVSSGPVEAREKIKLMYLESDAEVRAAVLINRMEMPLEVHRVGIFRVGKQLYGVVRFGAASDAGAISDRHRIGATAALLCDRIFGELPELVRIDFEGVSFRETKEKKPEVLFSASVDRNVWKTISKSQVALDRVQAAGVAYFDPRVQPGRPLPVKPAVKTKSKKGAKSSPKTPAKTAPTRDPGSKRESKKL